MIQSCFSGFWVTLLIPINFLITITIHQAKHLRDDSTSDACRASWLSSSNFLHPCPQSLTQCTYSQYLNTVGKIKSQVCDNLFKYCILTYCFLLTFSWSYNFNCTYTQKGILYSSKNHNANRSCTMSQAVTSKNLFNEDSNRRISRWQTKRVGVCCFKMLGKINHLQPH